MECLHNKKDLCLCGKPMKQRQGNNSGEHVCKERTEVQRKSHHGHHWPAADPDARPTREELWWLGAGAGGITHPDSGGSPTG